MYFDRYFRSHAMLCRHFVLVFFKMSRDKNLQDFWSACARAFSRLPERKALDDIDLNLVSHRYVSGVLKNDHFVFACSRASRF